MNNSNQLLSLIHQIQPSSSQPKKKPKKTISQWTKEEDEKLLLAIQSFGLYQWNLISEVLQKRTPKQCKERYYNHFDPSIVKKPWTKEEDKILLEKRKIMGNKWSEMKKFLPGRTANSIKNRFFSHFADSCDEKKKMNVSCFVPSESDYCIITHSPRFY